MTDKTTVTTVKSARIQAVDRTVEVHGTSEGGVMIVAYFIGKEPTKLHLTQKAALMLEDALLLLEGTPEGYTCVNDVDENLFDGDKLKA